jgi:DNA-binding NtrC family response regulator
MELLCAYSWPGNVRELRNVIERATIVAGGHFITTDDLPRLVDITRAPESSSARGLAPGLTVAEAEQQLIEVTLQHTNGNKTRAAELLGISLKTLHNKLNRAKEDDENAVTA